MRIYVDIHILKDCVIPIVIFELLSVVPLGQGGRHCPSVISLKVCNANMRTFTLPIGGST